MDAVNFSLGSVATIVNAFCDPRVLDKALLGRLASILQQMDAKVREHSVYMMVCFAFYSYIVMDQRYLNMCVKELFACVHVSVWMCLCVCFCTNYRFLVCMFIFMNESSPQTHNRWVNSACMSQRWICGIDTPNPTSALHISKYYFLCNTLTLLGLYSKTRVTCL